MSAEVVNTIHGATVYGSAVQAHSIQSVNITSTPYPAPARDRLWEQRHSVYEAFMTLWERFNELAEETERAWKQTYDAGQQLQNVGKALELLGEMRSLIYSRMVLLDREGARLATDASVSALNALAKSMKNRRWVEERTFNEAEREALLVYEHLDVPRALTEARVRCKWFRDHAAVMLGDGPEKASH